MASRRRYVKHQLSTTHQSLSTNHRSFYIYTFSNNVPVSGDIIVKDDLPVKQMRFGDTGTALDEKEARYRLGPLICQGDDLFNNVITFRIADSTINLPPFDMGHSGDIYLEFRTASENAVIFHARGPTDYIKLSIVGMLTMQPDP